MKLVLKVLKTVLRNKKKLFLKTVLKQKCFSVLRQKQSCSHGVKDGCKNLQRFSFKLLKPFSLSSEQGFKVFKNYKKFTTKLYFLENDLSINCSRCGFSVSMSNP